MKRTYLILCAFLVFISACGEHDPKYVAVHADEQELVYDGDFSILTNTVNEGDNTTLHEADTQEINRWITAAAERCFRDPDSTWLLLRPAIQRSRELNYAFGLGYAYKVLGFANFNKWDFKQAQKHFLSALGFFELLDSAAKFTPKVYVNLGNTYVVTDGPDSAFYYYQHALNLVGSHPGAPKLKISIYMGIGQCLILQEQYVQAKQYLNEAMALAVHLNDTTAIASCYAMKGSLYQELNPDSSRLFYRRAFELARLRNNKVKMESALYGIAQMWVVSGHADSAAYYFNWAEKILPSPRGRISDLFDLGNIYLVSGDYQKALDLYKQAELVLEDTVKGEAHLIVYSNLSRIYHRLGDNLQALKYKTLQFDLKDSLFTQEKVAAINRLDVKFRLTEKSRDLLAKQLLIAEQQGKIQRQYLGISLAAVLILLLVIILFRRKHRTTLDRINAKLAGIEQERLRLAQEIHDGIVSKLTSVKMNFNALPDFQEAPVAKHFNETLQHFDDSITELRRTTHNLHPSLLQHVGLLNALHSYVAQINAGGKIQIVTEVQGEFPGLDPDAELHLYRIVQELLQNVIKHSGADRAVIQLFWETEQLRIVISDNGKGREADESAGQKNGIGLHNLRDRIQLLHGTMKQQPTTSGTIIKLSFHLKHLSAKNV